MPPVKRAASRAGMNRDGIVYIVGPMQGTAEQQKSNAAMSQDAAAQFLSRGFAALDLLTCVRAYPYMPTVSWNVWSARIAANAFTLVALRLPGWADPDGIVARTIAVAQQFSVPVTYLEYREAAWHTVDTDPESGAEDFKPVYGDESASIIARRDTDG